jgi:steroid delta-isomerase
MNQETAVEAAGRIYRQWHDFVFRHDIEALIGLYAPDAVFESPLVRAVNDGSASGILRGHAEIKPFFDAAGRKRPKNVVRGYRTGRFLTDGSMLFWEYPRATPDGDQHELAEVIDIEGGVIRHHRVYFGWVGSGRLLDNALGKVRRG